MTQISTYSAQNTPTQFAKHIFFPIEPGDACRHVILGPEYTGYTDGSKFDGKAGAELVF